MTKYIHTPADPENRIPESIARQNDDGSISYFGADPANPDYQRYLRWLENPDAEEGGTL